VHSQSSRVAEALKQIEQRANQITGNTNSDLIRQALAKRIDAWESKIQNTTGGAVLGYREKRDGRTIGLLSAPGNQGWHLFTCLNSLRNVEANVQLILDEYGMDRNENRPWGSQKNHQDQEGEIL
jgi:hypothetical protein